MMRAKCTWRTHSLLLRHGVLGRCSPTPEWSNLHVGHPLPSEDQIVDFVANKASIKFRYSLVDYPLNLNRLN